MAMAPCRTTPRSLAPVTRWAVAAYIRALQLSQNARSVDRSLCPEEIDGLVGALEMVKFNPGKDFNIIFVSIDPTETPAIAAKGKAFYLKRYGRPQTAAGWHFLTGQQPAIDALAAATGYGYTRVPGPDGKMTQFAHASSIELLTPAGKLAQYYLGVEYAPRDLQLGLVDASGGQIGTPVDET